MSALESVKSDGYAGEVKLFGNGRKSVHMSFVLTTTGEPHIAYEVTNYNTLVLETRHLSLALETYDNL